MSPTALDSDDVVVYLERVRSALADLPPEERDALLADVESSLRDAAADSAEPIERRLGSPERFASELRSAAGFAPAAPVAPEGTRARLERRLRPFAARARDFTPLWWVARAYVAVAFAAMILGSSWYYRVPLIPILHSRDTTELIFAGALVVSLLLGPLRLRWMLGVDVLLALAIVPVAIQVAGNPDHPAALPSAADAVIPPAPLILSYGSSLVENVYAYDRRGHLLHDVRLFDNLGRPLNVGGSDPLRRKVRTAAGKAVLNAFPIRYYDPGTHRVRHPQAAPRRRVPPLRTPPLRP